MTATERSALQALRRAGAGELDGDFTIPELKRSFRRLARRLHPDAHPGADPAVARQLANAFASARDAYGVLRAAAPANA